MPQSASVLVGELDRCDEFADIRVDPAFTAARLLVTARRVPVGVVELELHAGCATAAQVRHAVHAELGHLDDPPPAATSHEPLTVVIPTRGRAASLERCLRAVLAGDHAHVSVLVIDNDPVDDSAFGAVDRLADDRVRYVHEVRRGASVARNRGLHEATTDIVAFVDDDTEPDRHWAARIAGAFAADPALACLSGPVLAARLTTADEIAADSVVEWSKGFATRRFSLTDPPSDSAVFPFSPGLFGVGANLAVRADVARAAGGFDEALGPGTPTSSGEDCEFLVRLVLAGHVLGYEPAAYVWHHHRPTTAALRTQVRGYAVGLGSFLAKIAFDPAARAAALRRLPAALAQLRRVRARAAAEGGSGLALMHGLVIGFRIYVNPRRAARRSGARIPPLTTPTGPNEDARRRGGTPYPSALGQWPVLNRASPGAPWPTPRPGGSPRRGRSAPARTSTSASRPIGPDAPAPR